MTSLRMILCRDCNRGIRTTDRQPLGTDKLEAFEAEHEGHMVAGSDFVTGTREDWRPAAPATPGVRRAKKR